MFHSRMVNLAKVINLENKHSYTGIFIPIVQVAMLFYGIRYIKQQTILMIHIKIYWSSSE